MAEADAAACRRNAAMWTSRADETALPLLRQSYLNSANAWNERAEQIEMTASLREARLGPRVTATAEVAPAAD